MKLSRAGYDFLRLTLQDVESGLVSQDQYLGATTRTDEQYPPKNPLPNLESHEDSDSLPQLASTSSAGGAQPSHCETGVSRRLGDTDYGKWESFAKRVVESEEIEQEKKSSAMREMQPMLQGCAHDRSQERILYEKPTLEKLLAADRFREEGNTCFRSMNLGMAAVFYRKALIQFDYAFPETQEETEWFDRSKLACHLNMAICKFKLQDWEESLAQCSSALRIDPKNSKALYRRGMIFLHLDKLKEAQEALLAAQTHSPGDPAIRSTIQELNQKIVAYRAKRRVVCNAMLGGSTDEDDGAEQK